jgi:predicted 2-oxoglutarate/Fe(II)-dependent dioxygenase YbiX
MSALPHLADAPLVRVWERMVSRSDCQAIIETMALASTVAGGVLRQSRDSVDPRLRRCSEHALPADCAARVVTAMREVTSRALGAGSSDGIRLEGPKFCSYGAGEYFRAHRDRSDDPLDPAVVRARRFSVVCLLNDDDPSGGLPVFDGGALVVYVPSGNGRSESKNIQLVAGSVVVFAADLLHEVRPVRSGVRHSAIGWVFRTDDIRETR